ncbi:kinase family protein [Hibiscus syriacus]|uniref:Kinase family protein n=1 Tax=Hibiscus syriacus TaxID=106335 RepID=A0A6A2XN57_HIBSY|nr:kinase family protein [Hibiscus syriacus]
MDQVYDPTEPSFADRLVINHGDYLTNRRILTSATISITNTEVLTADGRHIVYDYLVIATGHADPVPVTEEERLHQYEAGKKLQKLIVFLVVECIIEDFTYFEHDSSAFYYNAQSILIVGGGPSGVELAGEIATDFSRKKVTLVHKGQRLVEFIGTKASDKSLGWLRSKKVEVKIEQAVDLNSTSDGSRIYRTSTGESIKADCHFLCVAKPLATLWLSETIMKTNLDKWKELKQGYIAHKHATVVFKNLKLLMDGGKESKMTKYKPVSVIAMVSLVMKDAIAQFPFTTLSGRVPGLLKSGDLFVGRTRKQMGLQP